MAGEVRGPLGLGLRSADVGPDAAGPLIDRLKQLGKVARFEVQRKQTTPDGTTQPAPGARLERAETRIHLSLYNLANVAPRQTTNLNLAAVDAEAAYRAITARVEKAGGRVVTAPDIRGTGMGRDLMREGLAGCRRHWPGRSVRNSAQARLQRFYTGLGFAATGDEYLEDQLPHIEMLWRPE